MRVQPPTLHQAASEIATYMPLDVVTTAEEEVDVSMTENTAEYMEEGVDEVEKEMAEEVMA